jgi:hypothetical protein
MMTHPNPKISLLAGVGIFALLAPARLRAQGTVVFIRPPPTHPGGLERVPSNVGLRRE